MTTLSYFLNKESNTYLLSYMLNPLLRDLLRSNIVLISYLPEPGERTPLTVKSLFLPYPIPAPDLRKVEGILYILSQLHKTLSTRRLLS